MALLNIDRDDSLARMVEKKRCVTPRRENSRERLLLGGHAAIGWGAARNPGYHSRKVASQSPFNTRVRICSSRCAPQGVQAICCFLQKRLLIT